METIFTLSTVILGLTSYTIMKKTTETAMRIMCLSLATASGLCWANRELYTIISPVVDTSVIEGSFSVSISLCLLIEGSLLYEFLNQSKQQYGKITRKDWTVASLLFLGIHSWVILYQLHLYSPSHFYLQLVAIPVLSILIAFQMLSCCTGKKQNLARKTAHLAGKNDLTHSDELHEISESIHQLDAIPALLQKLIHENQILKGENSHLTSELEKYKQVVESKHLDGSSHSHENTATKTK